MGGVRTPAKMWLHCNVRIESQFGPQ